MKSATSIKKLWQKALYRAFCMLLLAVLMVSICNKTLIHADTGNAGTPAWANPSATAVKRVSAIDNVQHQPTLLSNLDCTSLTYRLVGNSTMQTGCFTPTSFGMLDSDSENVIFNGIDEAVPLLAYSPHQVLAPWPKALNLLALDAVDTGGSYIGMYKNPLANLQNQRDATGQLTSKKFTGPPETSLTSQAGQRLIINPQTMAFSDGGSWLVVETLGGSFVRINLASLDMVAFAQSFGSQGSPGTLLKSQVAISGDGRYAAVENTVASSFKIYDLATCNSSAASWQTSNCQSHDYWPFVSQQVSGLQSIHHVRFLDDDLLSFEATSTNPANSGVYELAPTASITSLTDYIGLGDSYTSGEGAFDYLAGTDTSDNFCHLSASSYPLLLTHDLFSAGGGHSVACSGAVINDVGSTSDSYKGQVRNGASLTDLAQNQPAFLDSIKAGYLPGYVSQQTFVKQYQPKIVTVSIGGNDIGFGDMLQNCVEPHLSRHLSDSTCYNTYESRVEMVNLVNRTVPRWTALYKQLRAESPGTTIYAIGYPSIASDTGSCGLNVNLGKSELEFAEELIAYLNGAIQQSASVAGVPYIDIGQALAGHRLCETSGDNLAVNGLTAGKDSGILGINVLGKESYHPNALGHKLIEEAILQKSRNLSVGLNGSGQIIANPGNNLLNALKSGRTINALIPDDTLIKPVLRASVSNTLQIDGQRDGLQPNSSYAVRLDGPSGTVLASLPSDANGNLAGAITIPSDTAVGGHTIDVTGVNQAGEPADVIQPIYIAANDLDTDGDGVIDEYDSCPTALNSNQDTDKDGVDDVCDGLIAPPPASTGNSQGNDPGAEDNPGEGSAEPISINSPIASLETTAGIAAELSGKITASSGITLSQIVNTVANLPGTGLANTPVSVPHESNVAGVLGAKTMNPIIIKPVSLHSADKSKARFFAPIYRPKPAHWQGWLLFCGVFLLLLVLLCLGLAYLFMRDGRAEYI